MRVVPPQTGAGLFTKSCGAFFFQLFVGMLPVSAAGSPRPEIWSTALLEGKDFVLERCKWWPAPSDGDGAGINTGLKRRGSGHGVSR